MAVALVVPSVDIDRDIAPLSGEKALDALLGLCDCPGLVGTAEAGPDANDTFTAGPPGVSFALPVFVAANEGGGVVVVVAGVVGAEAALAPTEEGDVLAEGSATGDDVAKSPSSEPDWPSVPLEVSDSTVASRTDCLAEVSALAEVGRSAELAPASNATVAG